jgi:transcriptional/translational regulatory protein YebC/TACO1
MFSRVGQIIYPASAASADAMLEAVIDAGGENVESGDMHDITTTVDDFGAVRIALEKKFGEPQSAKLTWNPKTLVPVAGEAAQNLLKLLDALEDDDDVQDVIGNFDIAEADLQKMAS